MEPSQSICTTTDSGIVQEIVTLHRDSLSGVFHKYGTIFLKKGMVLYTSYHRKHFPDIAYESRDIPKLNEKKAKYRLIYGFHPSEIFPPDTYIHMIRLERDIRLLFIIEYIHDIRVHSTRESPTKIKEEGFDGWMASDNYKSYMEIFLLCDRQSYTHIGCEEIVKSWRNPYYDKETQQHVSKNWGDRYPITFLQDNMYVRICVNQRYKVLFRKYRRAEKKSKRPNSYILQILLKHAYIKYYKSNIPPPEKIDIRSIFDI